MKCIPRTLWSVKAAKPIVLDDSDETIQLATTFDDPSLKDVTAKALLTDSLKINPLSDPIDVSIGLGEVTSAATQELEQ